MIRAYLPLAAGFGLTGVALGAFAAHGLKASLSAEYLAIFQTAVLYQLIHALALFGVALLSLHAPGRLLRAAGALFAIGVVLFSGSLYLLTHRYRQARYRHAAGRYRLPRRLAVPGAGRLAPASSSGMNGCRRRFGVPGGSG